MALDSFYQSGTPILTIKYGQRSMLEILTHSLLIVERLYRSGFPNW